jgi:hypothetical protein
VSVGVRAAAAHSYWFSPVHVVLAVGLLAHLAPFSKEQNFCLDSRQPWQMNNLRRQTMAQFANSPLGWLSTHCHSRTTCVLPERASEWVKCRRGAIDSLSWSDNYYYYCPIGRSFYVWLEIVNKMCRRCTAFLKVCDKRRSEREIACQLMLIYCPSWKMLLSISQSSRRHTNWN